MTHDSELKLVPDADVIEQRMDEQFVLLHLRTNQFYQLNPTAARFWELIRAGLDLGQIQEQLLVEFDVDAAKLNDELRAMIDIFQEQKLVMVHEQH